MLCNIKKKLDSPGAEDNQKISRGKLLLEGIMRARQAVDHPFMLEAALERFRCFLAQVKSLRDKLDPRVQATPILDMMERWCAKFARFASTTSNPWPSESVEPFTDEEDDDYDFVEVIKGLKPLAKLVCPLCQKVPKDARRIAVRLKFERHTVDC